MSTNRQRPACLRSPVSGWSGPSQSRNSSPGGPGPPRSLVHPPVETRTPLEGGGDSGLGLFVDHGTGTSDTRTPRPDPKPKHEYFLSRGTEGRGGGTRRGEPSSGPLPLSYALGRGRERTPSRLGTGQGVTRVLGHGRVDT